MGKAIAIALVRDNALASVAKSTANFLRLVSDFMYGTPERARYTYAFIIGLGVLICMLQLSDANAFSTCSHDTLTGAL